MKMRAVTVAVAELLLKIYYKICHCLCMQAGASGEI